DLHGVARARWAGRACVPRGPHSRRRASMGGEHRPGRDGRARDRGAARPSGRGGARGGPHLMLHGYRVIDADSHVMEPDDLFDGYVDRAFRGPAPKTRRIATDWPYFADMDVLGHKWPATLNWEDIHYLDDGRTYMDAYAEYLAREWGPDAYVRYMDQ